MEYLVKFSRTAYYEMKVQADNEDDAWIWALADYGDEHEIDSTSDFESIEPTGN